MLDAFTGGNSIWNHGPFRKETGILGHGAGLSRRVYTVEAVPGIL